MNFARAEDVELILKTNKQSDSGIFSNERLLMIKAGVVSYFSEVPKKFSGTIKFIESSGQYPKYTIKANDIDSMELKSNVLSLLFKKNKLIGREEFRDMVKSQQPIPEAASSHSQRDGNGYVKWNFQTDNMEMMQQFFRLTNLFRSSNPKFKPSLNAVIDGYRDQSQKPKSRQMSMTPAQSNKMYNSDLNKKRMSEVPSNFEGKDLFLESLGLVEKKNEKADLRDSAPLMVPQPFDQKTADLESLKQNSVKETDRLSRLITRISVMNQPSMGTILEKDSEDKLSEISRNPRRESLVQKKFQIKSSTSEIVFYSVTPSVQIEKVIQEPPLVVSQSQIEVVEINLDKPSTILQIILPSESKLSDIQEQPITNESKPKVPQRMPLSHKKRKDRSYIELNASVIASETESKMAEQESKRRKANKVRNFFKATSYIDHFDPIQICKKMQISLEDLEKLMKTHSKEEESAWNYIESNLAYRLAKQKINPSNNQKLQQLHLNTDLIEQYHILPEKQIQNIQQSNKKHLDPDISYISAEEINQEDQQALKWMEKQIQNTNPQLFTSKTLKNSHFKFYARPIDFSRDNIVALSGCWILNRGGYLEQLLGYLRLERVLKEISSKISQQMELVCADTIYLRYKHYEAIAKQWRIGYPSFPIKSIKALEYISRSRQLKLFERDFPQFNIIAEIIREGYHYRLHIERIEGNFTADESALQNQFSKIVFSHDNELDLFYHSSAYEKIETYCLKQIDSILKSRKRVGQDDVYGLLEGVENNITVDTLCKLLCCRIDKKGSLFFNHTLLRLGGRQFGQQLSLIRRYKKRGNNELGRELSKKLMGRLQIYQQVTPISHFIQIYLQIIDFMIVNEKQLHRAVPILLKVLHHLSEYQSEQYSVYLALMKTYLKLNEIDNFVKILENCRLFISQMFRQCSMLVDYPLQRIVLMLLLRQNTEKALGYSNKLIEQLKKNEYFENQSKQKYLSKLQWDRNNILVSLGRYYEAYSSCESVLQQIETVDSYYPDYWIEGVLCLSKCWVEIGEVNSVNSAMLQKKIARAIELSFSRENIEMVFVIYQIGLKVIAKSQDNNLPCNLQNQPAFEQAKIEFNQTQAEIFNLLTQKQEQPI